MPGPGTIKAAEAEVVLEGQDHAVGQFRFQPAQHCSDSAELLTADAGQRDAGWLSEGCIESGEIDASDVTGMRRQTSQTTTFPEDPFGDGRVSGQPAWVQILGRSGCRQGFETPHGPDLTLCRLGADGTPGQRHLVESFTAEFDDVSVDPVPVSPS